MKDMILENLDAPERLEQIYRRDKGNFKRVFNELYPEISGNSIAEAWNARLNYFDEKQSRASTNRELIFVIIASLIAIVIAKLPDILTIEPDTYYPRNLGFIVFPALAAYFAWKNRLPNKTLTLIYSMTVFSLLFINLLPQNEKSQTFILSCTHLPVVLWTLLGVSFTGSEFRQSKARLAYLRYIGDLIVMTTLILIAGAILSGITVTLFELIDMDIKLFYLKNIVLSGLASAPIVATYIIRNNQQIVSKVSPIIAKIFSPLVLVMVSAYLIAMIVTGKDPYNDREFLLVFNMLLIGVMAIIFFTVAEATGSGVGRSQVLILFLLSLATIIVNAIALSAIIFRISEWGISPNKIAVLAANTLILINLLIVAYRLFGSLKDISKVESVGDAIAKYIPVYAVWAAIVVFVFPFVFGFN